MLVHDSILTITNYDNDDHDDDDGDDDDDDEETSYRPRICSKALGHFPWPRPR